MKTIANIMIINSQNVKPEHLTSSSHHNMTIQHDSIARDCLLVRPLKVIPYTI